MHDYFHNVRLGIRRELETDSKGDSEIQSSLVETLAGTGVPRYILIISHSISGVNSPNTDRGFRLRRARRFGHYDGSAGELCWRDSSEGTVTWCRVPQCPLATSPTMTTRTPAAAPRA